MNLFTHRLFTNILLDDRLAASSAILRWAGLEGDGEFLGHGTRGSAWRFGNGKLKITTDTSEAQTSALISKHPHPNLQAVRSVVQYRPLSKVYCILSDYTPAPSSLLESLLANLNQHTADNMLIMWDRGFSADILVDGAIDELEDFEDDRGRLDEWLQDDDTIAFIDVYIRTLWPGLEERSLAPERWIEALERCKSSPKHKRINDYFSQIGSALRHLVDIGVDYYDLSGDNVGEENGVVKLYDIGYAKIVDPENLELLESHRIARVSELLEESNSKSGR